MDVARSVRMLFLWYWFLRRQFRACQIAILVLIEAIKTLPHPPVEVRTRHALACRLIRNFGAFQHAILVGVEALEVGGRNVVTEKWTGLVEGRTLKLSWYPAMVAIGGEADIAYSSGPALYEHLAPGAEPSFRIGGFQSIWHRGDGVWRVLFDDGIEPKPATAAEVAAFHAGRQTACPKT